MSEVVINYESRLNQDPRWAMSEGDRFFEETSETHQTLRRIARRLSELGIPYSIVGGMALAKHGFRRFTEDVDILVKKEDLKTIHEKLTGLGYTPPFERSKNLRDTQSGVRIEFLTSGSFPGDGKEKPISFPAPEEVAEVEDGISYVNLKTLIELKLASGMSGADRMKDLADVQELIKLIPLSRDYVDVLNPYVRSKYDELWLSVNENPRRYLRFWPVPDSFSLDSLVGVKSMESLIQKAGSDEAILSDMRDSGVLVDLEKGIRDGKVLLFTTDPEVAKRFDMHEESEFLDDD